MSNEFSILGTLALLGIFIILLIAAISDDVTL